MTIQLLRKKIGVGRWLRKRQFPLNLSTENVPTYLGRYYGFKKAPKQPYTIVKWSLTSFFGELEVLFFGVSNPAEEVVEVVVVVEG